MVFHEFVVGGGRIERDFQISLHLSRDFGEDWTPSLQTRDQSGGDVDDVDLLS